MLGKRTISEELIEETEVEEAVAREVKRRRKNLQVTEQPLTLHEKRIKGRSNITKLIKENKNLIVSWDDLLGNYLKGKQSKLFIQLRSISDFIDGFELRVNEGLTGP